MEFSKADVSRIVMALDAKIEMLSRPIAGFSVVAQTIVNAEIGELEALVSRLRGKPLTARQQRARALLADMAAHQTYNTEES